MTQTKIILTGTIKNLKVHTTKKGEKMALADFESENNDIIEVVFFPHAWKEYKVKIKEGKIVTLCGEFGDKVQNSKTGENGLAISFVVPRVKKTEEALITNWDLIKNPQKYEKSLNLKIHRGTNEIGGTCVEIWTDNARIVVDMGMPLVNPDKTPFDEKETEKHSRDKLIQDNILPNIPSLYEDGSNTALIIPHSHKDHYGFMKYVNSSCPVYLGFGTQLLIELTNTFGDNKWTINNAKHIINGKKFNIGDIEITPYLMDHAAFDSYAFLIEAHGKSILYSGDFRLHGRTSKEFQWFCNDVKKTVDYLLLEGTTIGRQTELFPTEEELEEQFVKTFNKTRGINLIYVSAHNIDRIKSIYFACRRCKNKILLIDFYTANVLKTLNKKADSTIPFPSQLNYKDIRVYYPHFLTNRMLEHVKKPETVRPFRPHKLGRDEIDKMASQLVMIVRPTVQYDLERYLKKYENGCFIYSMWHGYKDKPGKTKDFLDFIASKGMPIKDIHTSGHADLFGLKRMVEAVKPKHIVPIHTEKAKSYKELFSEENVREVDDGQTIQV